MLRLANSLKYCFYPLLASFATGAFAGTLDFAAASYSVAENGSTLVVTVARTGALGSAAGVTVRSVDGTATAGNDFNTVSAALNWDAGSDDPETLNITITDDAIVEGDETFTLELQSPTGDSLGTVDSIAITISDFEEGTLEFMVSEFIAEESAGTTDIVINRVNGTDGEVGVTIKTADDTAKVESDYEALDSAIVLADGVASATVPLILTDDSFAELTETLSLTLSAVSGGAQLGSAKEATLTISDDDTDFTTSLEVIELESTTITQPPLLDLGQASIMNAELTYLDTINEIAILQTGEVEATQTSGGLLEILLGTDKFYFQPLSALRSDAGAEASVIIAEDNSAQFITAHDITISVQPALGGLSTFQSAIAEVELPELTVTTGGNITIQMDQGPAPFELNNLGELVINNSFYNRWHFRPMGVASISDASAARVGLVAHPILASESMVSVVFADGAVFREQFLTTAPVNAAQLVESIDSRVGITDTTVLDYGLITFQSSLETFAGISGATTFTLYADYEVRRAISDSTLLLGLFDAGDVNGDGMQDFRMVYANGDEQYLLLKSAE